MICRGGLHRFDPRLVHVAALALAWMLALGLPAGAQKQGGASLQDQSNGDADALKQRNKELEKLRGEQSKSAEAEAAIKREIEKIGADRRKLNQDLIATAARLRDAEGKVADTEDRLKPLDDEERDLRKSLDGRRAAIGEVLAALQRIGRRPPPALLASPEDALQAVRTAMVLGAVLPVMRRDVQALASNLSDLLDVRKKITAERDRLKAQVANLGAERTRMTALVAARQKQQTEREQALQIERTHAAKLAEQADNLKDLIAKLEQSLGPATRAAREASPGNAKPLAALHDPGRLTPAVSFASLRGKVPMPVNGIKIRDYGAPNGSAARKRASPSPPARVPR